MHAQWCYCARGLFEDLSSAAQRQRQGPKGQTLPSAFGPLLALRAWCDIDINIESDMAPAQGCHAQTRCVCVAFCSNPILYTHLVLGLRDERAKQQCQKLVLKAVDIAACSTPVWKDALLALGKTSTDVLAPVLRVGIHLSGTPVLSYVQRFIERERGVYALPLMHQCVVLSLT